MATTIDLTELATLDGATGNLRPPVSYISAAPASLSSFTSTSWTDSGATVTVTTTKANQVVLVSWTGEIGHTAGTVASDIFFLGLDYSSAQRDLLLVRGVPVTGGGYHNGSFCIPIVFATAAAYTIKLIAKVSAGTWALDEATTGNTFVAVVI
jgi:hypothetical protein